MVKISYAICVCNEDRELNSLVNFLLKVKDEDDEVNILVVIDADEMPQEALITNIKTFEGDIMYVPRVNICPGYTADWITDYKFNLNEMGWVNWPDYQGRYYKNNGEIKWSNDLHEKLEGPNPDKVAKLEAKPLIALWHIKTVERQDRQRAYYESL